MKILFTDNDFPDIDLERKLFADAGITLKVAQCKTADDVIRESEDCVALLVEYAQVNAKVFAARPNLKLVSRIGAGFDTINTADAQAANVWVANSPDYGSSEVALHALSMALSLLRHLPQYDAHIRQGVWDAHATGTIPRLANLTVGVLGYGRIGSRFAYFAHTMFKRVIASDPYRIDGDFAPYVDRVDTETLFSEADVISLHTPLNDETRGMVGARLLDRMKPGSYLVNTSRGGVIDLPALEARLSQFDGVGLDVLPVEPIPRNSLLLTAKNTILTPHAAYYTVDAARELRRKAAQNIVTWAKTGKPDYPVVSPR
jgi:phosphoglycerate dehydrogenase-like enzyme